MKIRTMAATVLGMTLVLMMTACGIGKQWIFSLNGEKLYNKDIDAYGYVYVMDHNIANDGQMDTSYDEKDTYAEHYKKELEDELLSNVLLRQAAQDDKIGLSAKEKKACKKKAEALVNTYGEDTLKQKGLTQKDIQNVYEDQRLAENYVTAKGKEDSVSRDIEDDPEKERYVAVYQILFPTVQLDDNGFVRSGDDGRQVEVSAEEKAQQKERAEELHSRVSDGENIETAWKTFSSYVTGNKTSYLYRDLDGEYKKQVDVLSEGQISEVFEGKYGYYIVRLDQKEDTEYSDRITNYEKQETIQNLQKELINDLYTRYVGNDKGYRNDKRWEAVSILEYLK